MVFYDAFGINLHHFYETPKYKKGSRRRHAAPG